MSHYAFERYDGLRRWISYWYQVDRVLSGPPGAVLLVGVGSGVTVRELRARGRQVTTLDVDTELEPDVVASVAELPFEDGAFASSVCCQVLEHLPWEQARVAMAELRRVTSGRLVISVPDVRYYAGLGLFDGVRRKEWFPRLDLPRILGRANVPEEHCWEIGRAGTPPGMVRSALEAAGMVVEEDFRVRLFPYHHYFIGRPS